MDRTDIINFYTSNKDDCRYLEIGVGCMSANFNKIKAAYKDGVDPVNNCNNKMTSDAFFLNNNYKYDVIFIDGDHRSDQVIKDIDNSLKFIEYDGVIILHDCNPTEENRQRDYIVVQKWNGSVWKAILHYQLNSDLFICTVDVDEGIGIIKPNKKRVSCFSLSCENPTYEFFDVNRKKILNLISVDEWKIIEGIL